MMVMVVVMTMIYMFVLFQDIGKGAWDTLQHDSIVLTLPGNDNDDGNDDDDNNNHYCWLVVAVMIVMHSK